jgi:hypothetical protein
MQYMGKRSFSMKDNLTKILLAVCSLLLIGVLIGLFAVNLTRFPPPPPPPEVETQPGTTVKVPELPSPPPVPKAVNDPARIQQNLVAGKTYTVRTRGTLNVHAEDSDWGLSKVVTINYAYTLRVDRNIISNDGKTIVEERKFSDGNQIKIASTLDNLKLDLGDSWQKWALAIAALNPKVRVAAAMLEAIDGVSLMPLVQVLSLVGVKADEIVGAQAQTKAFAVANSLNGKTVRIVYEDGKGVLELTPTKGVMTDDERDLHCSSGLLSDSLIFPNTKIEVNQVWTVDGSNFANILDPSMLVSASGDIQLRRKNDHKDANGNVFAVIGVDRGAGRIMLKRLSGKHDSMVYFDPEGTMSYSLDDSIITHAKLHGTGKLDHFSKNHLLFKTRMKQQPTLEMEYSCEISK